MSDKAYRISVVLLLVLILGGQLFAQFYVPKPTEDCLTAIEDATGANNSIQTNLAKLVNSYDTAVYDRADNINQQIFLSNEYIFQTMAYSARAEQAILKIQIACR